MDIELTIKNYRCFPDHAAATIQLRDGFTAFVGPNNAGKSSLLRFFYEFRDLFNQLQNPDSRYWEAVNQRHGFTKAPSVLDPNEVFSNQNDRPIIIRLASPVVKTETDSVSARTLAAFEITIPRGETNYQLGLFSRKGPVERLDHQWKGMTIRDAAGATWDLAPYFEAFRAFAGCFYIGAFRNILNVGTKDDYFDIRVGESFVKQWREYQTGQYKVRNKAIHDLVQAVRLIFGFEKLEVQASQDEKTLQLFLNGQSYKLPEVGSGLAQFLMVLANAMVNRPELILIDEPEQHLHPTLQVDFLSTLAAYARKGVIFATHSVGLARSVAESIYSVSHDGAAARVKEFEKTPNLAEWLGEMSFSSYRDLGCDKVVLVEGPTEVLTIQQFLRLLKKDHKVALLPLGGGGMINANRDSELAEILRISQNVEAIIDSERAAAGAPLDPGRQAFVTSCQNLSIRCHVLNRRAIENYFPETAIRQEKGPTYRALGPFEDFKTVSPRWGKAENWRIASRMTAQDLNAADDLGALIAAI